MHLACFFTAQVPTGICNLSSFHLSSVTDFGLSAVLACFMPMERGVALLFVGRPGTLLPDMPLSIGLI